MLIDTHSHLHFKSYDTDRDEVHARMAEFDVKTITIGTAMNTSRGAVAYADAHPDTWAAVGYHPDHVTSDFEDEDEIGATDEPYDPSELEKVARSSPRVLAIGEVGLDYHYFTQAETFKPGMTIDSAKELQKKVFHEQADIAVRLNKTLIVHARDSAQDMVEEIANLRQAHPDLRIVIHGFSEKRKTADAYLDLGCYIGIGGIVTFKPRKETLPEDRLEAIVQAMPLDRLLVETDAPWLAPVPVRGTRSEPALVRYIVEHIARARGLDRPEICRITTENAQKAFACDFR